jgi:hypothetical protein
MARCKENTKSSQMDYCITKITNFTVEDVMEKVTIALSQAHSFILEQEAFNLQGRSKL